MKSVIRQANFLNLKKSFVEVAVGVMCSSMPAMTSFSKLHIFRKDFYTSIRSRLLFHRYGKHSEDVKMSDSAKRKHLFLASSFADKFHLDSFTQLRDDQGVVMDDVVFPRGTTKTSVQVGEPSGDIESGQIGKSVTVEQSSKQA